MFLRFFRSREINVIILSSSHYHFGLWHFLELIVWDRLNVFSLIKPRSPHWKMSASLKTVSQWLVLFIIKCFFFEFVWLHPLEMVRICVIDWKTSPSWWNPHHRLFAKCKACFHKSTASLLKQELTASFSLVFLLSLYETFFCLQLQSAKNISRMFMLSSGGDVDY